MTMSSIDGIGYCILCGNPIRQNKDSVLCPDCITPHYDPYDTALVINGIFCHICGTMGNYSHRYPFCRRCEGLDREGGNKNSAVYREWLDKYKKRDSLNYLEPLWACNGNLNQRISYSNGFHEKMVDIMALVNATNLDKRFNLNEIFENDYRSNCRILNILERWNRKLYVDPPLIIQNKNGIYYYRDGQHRTIAAYYLKAKSIPILLKKEK